jgi:8-oxo-dGTP pyrophosphatase MutT (NUDIX family)
MNYIEGVIGLVYNKSTKKYLLINNKGTKNTTFPAGKKEKNETLKQTIARELKEEIGLSPSEYKLVKTPIIHKFVYNSKKVKRNGQATKQIVYLIETSKTHLTPEDSEIEIKGWFNKKQVLEKLTFFDLKKLFLQINKYLKSKKE